MADTIVANTQLDSSKMAMIAAAAQKSLAFSAKLFPLVTDLSFMVGKGMKSLDLPKLGEFTVTNRASGAAADATVLSDGTDLMLLNKVPHVNFIIDPQDEIQSRLDVQLEYASRAAASLGRFVDSAIVTELNTVGTQVGAAGVITKAWVLAAREYIATNNGDLSNASLIVNAESEGDLLAIDDFVRYDSTGVSASAIVTGMIGRIYGIPVVMSNALASGEYHMFEKGGIVAAFQRQPQIGRAPVTQYGPTAERWAIEAQFGVKGVQIEVGTALAGKSALVASDSN
jgi:hypothetical protein